MAQSKHESIHARTRKDSQQPENFSAGRFAILRLSVVLVFLALGLQLLHVQILQGPRYRLLAQDNLIKVIPSLPSRGLIFDRLGRPLVGNVPTYSATLTPAQLPKGHEQDVYDALQGLLGVPSLDLQRRVSAAVKQNTADQPLVIKSQLDPTVVLRLAELRSQYSAIDIRTDPARQYLNANTSAAVGSFTHILGYVGKLNAAEYRSLKGKGYQMDDQVGKSGLELSYEDRLRGTPGQRTVEVDAAGHELRTLDQQAPIPGDNLALTIDSTLQDGVTKILADTLRQYKSPSGVAVMMDIHTGDILAYVSLPTYDNNLLSGPVPDSIMQQLLKDPGRPLVDHAINDQYPPGSTFKEITGLAALQEGVATTATTLVTDGKLKVPHANDPTTFDIFPDWSNLGTLDFRRAVAMSSDVYFYCLSGGNCPQLQTGLGVDRIARYAHMFGLGAPTGIDLPGEVPGIVPDKAWKQKVLGEDWYLGDTYFFGIGQGYVATTPLQMLRVVSAIANGGDLMRPHIVHEVRDANGNLVQTNEPTVDRHLDISPQNFETMREGMLQVVENGSAPGAKVPGVRIGGKSGTAEFGAQLSSPSGEQANGTYNEHGWFVSFAPYDNPQVALVVFDEKGGGALTAGPTSSKIWDYYFHQYLPSRSGAASAVSPSATATPR